jgi:hypothetical protein
VWADASSLRRAEAGTLIPLLKKISGKWWTRKRNKTRRP